MAWVFFPPTQDPEVLLGVHSGTLWLLRKGAETRVQPGKNIAVPSTPPGQPQGPPAEAQPRLSAEDTFPLWPPSSRMIQEIIIVAKLTT